MMKKKLLYTFIAIILMMFENLHVNAKIVIDANSTNSEIINGTLTQNGVTISGIKEYAYDTEMTIECAFGTTNFTINSTVGKIAMIGISYSPYDFQEELFTNNRQGDFNNKTNNQPKNSNYQNWMDVSVGSIEHVNISCYSDGFDYSVWHGLSSTVYFNCKNQKIFVASFHIYFEGESLPNNKPFTISNYTCWFNYEGPSDYSNSLTICYGFANLMTEEHHYGDWAFHTRIKELNEGSSLPNPYHYWEDDYDYYEQIDFDNSITEYKPQNISNMFRGINCSSIVNFTKLDLSEVINANNMFYDSDVKVINLRISEGQNLSNMFSGYKNKILNISTWDFSRSTIVTGMFSNSSISILTVGPSINNTWDDIFNGLGTYNNPCNLEIVGDVDLGQDPGNKTFYWKGGYFKIAKKEAYVSVEKEIEILDDYYEEVHYYYTLRYDNKRSSYDKTFSIDEEGEGEFYKWVEDFNSMYDNKDENEWLSLSIDPSFADYRPVVTNYMFRNCKADYIDGLQYLNTSEVTEMSYMFDQCYNLTSLNISHFDTSNVTDMSGMFSGCSNLTSLDLSHFDTSNVTDIFAMFLDCSNLTSINLSNFNTSNIENMQAVFAGCSNLTSLDLSSFDTSKVYNMTNMFFGCSNLTSLDLSNFDTSNVIRMPSMFAYCLNLTSIDVSSFNTSKVGDMTSMFAYCEKLTSLDVSNFDMGYVIDEVRNYSSEMFLDCISLHDLSISATMGDILEDACTHVGTKNNPCVIKAPEGFDFEADTNQSYFIWKSGYFKLNIGPFATLSDDGKTLTFSSGLKPNNIDGNVFSFNTADANPAWYSQRTNITKVVFEPSFTEFKPISTYGWFRGMENLEEIEGLEYLNTSETTLMSYMFYGCSKLKSIDVSFFDTKKVEKMGYLFQNCASLESIDISNFDYSANTSCYRMFNGCTNLKEVNFGEWKNNANNQYGYMFAGCSSLENLDLSLLILPSDAKTTSMLNGCKALRLLSISSSMSALNSSACSGVGTADSPCELVVPDGFDPEVDTSGNYFRWKGGYFKLPNLWEIGDVNHDGQMTVQDVMMAVNYVIGQHPAYFYVENADMDDDGFITVTDVISIVNLVVNAPTANAPALRREAITDAITLTPTTEGYAVSLRNNEPYTALQMDIQMPNDAPLNARLMDIRSDGHSIVCSNLGNGHHRIAIYSLNGHALKDNDGILLQLQTSTNHDALPEIYDVQLTNRLFESVTLSDISIPTDITNVNTDDTPDAPAYNTQGIRSSKNYRSIIIQSGRKIVAK